MDELIRDFEPAGYHRFCLEFPSADDFDFQNLVRSMKTEGFHESEPIILLGNEILDGRTRYEAALIAGVKPLFKRFAGTEADAHNFVYLKNLARRHLNNSQRAALAAQIPNLTTKERAAIANVSESLQATTDEVWEKAPEFFQPIVDGKARASVFTPVVKSPDIRKEALKYLQKDDIDGLLALLRGGGLRSFQSITGTTFDIKRSRQLGNMVKFDNIFTEVQKFLNQLDGITELIEELAKADKGFEQKQLWEHFSVELRSAVPDFQARIKKVIAKSKVAPKFDMLAIWNDILDEIKQQSNLIMNRKQFSPLLIKANAWKEQEQEVYDRFLRFLDEILQIATVMQDDSKVEFNVNITTGKTKEVEAKGGRKQRIPKFKK